MTTRITPGVGANLLGQHSAERNRNATTCVGNLDPQIPFLFSFLFPTSNCTARPHSVGSCNNPSQAICQWFDPTSTTASSMPPTTTNSWAISSHAVACPVTTRHASTTTPTVQATAATFWNGCSAAYAVEAIPTTFAGGWKAYASAFDVLSASAAAKWLSSPVTSTRLCLSIESLTRKA
ncbi:unnamed protein product [Musa acuminata subsp. burmannicoides]